MITKKVKITNPTGLHMRLSLNAVSDFVMTIRWLTQKVYSVYLVHALKAEMKSCSSVRDRMKKKQWKQW